MDVKTAFLRAPRDHSREVVVVQPPAIFVLAGLCSPDTLWLVEKALYGLTTSPKEWTQFRSERVKDFEWKEDGKTYKVEKTNDQDIWKIVQLEENCITPAHRCRSPGGAGDGTASAGGATVGLFVTYVDDVLAIGRPEVLKGFCSRMAQEWEVGAPEWIEDGGAPVRFLGMEVEKKQDTYYIHQKSYLADLLGRYPGEKRRKSGKHQNPRRRD